MRIAAALIGTLCRIDVFESHSDRFSKALEICQTSAKKDIRDLDMSKSHSWDDVMAEYKHACMKYDAKAKGLRGLPRKWGRMTGDNVPSIIPFLNFIPEGQYKTLFAGLLLIFGVSLESAVKILRVCNGSVGCKSDEQQETPDSGHLWRDTSKNLRGREMLRVIPNRRVNTT